MIIFCGYKILWALLKNRAEFKKPYHTLIYGSFYTQYRDHPTVEQSRIWFFIVVFTYDFIRALVIGLGQKSAVVQITGLFVTEVIYFTLLQRKKPFEVKLMNNLEICMSFLRFVVVCMLYSFLSDKRQHGIEIAIELLQLIIIGMLVVVIIMNIINSIRGFINKKNNKNDEDTKDNGSVKEEQEK